MSANQINVRRKETKGKSPKMTSLLIGSGVVAVLSVILVSAFFLFGDRFNFASANLEITASGKNKIIRVPKGANLQAAIDQADSGDVIELESGAVYDSITLPKKNISDFITIRSSKAAQLPEEKRVTPEQAKLMAQIVTKGKNVPAITAENAAHHYRFVGIEFTTQTDDHTQNLIFLGVPEKLAEVAHHIEFDRCFIHSQAKSVTIRGIAVNSADTIIKNSYFQGFAYPQQETQAICGWTGTKNVSVLNNYIEGGAENVMFGGSDPKSADLIPSDIEVRGNHFNKPAEWKDKFTTKCLFELKDAKRVKFTGNYLENNWYGAAFRITVRNQENTAPFSTIEDVLIQDNVVKGMGDGIQILGMDDTYKSRTLKGLNIINNLFLNIGGKNYEGGGYFIQVSGGEDILIANNTAFNEGNLANFYGDMPKNFLFRDNIVGHSDYGIHGFDGIKTAAGQKLFRNNVIVNNKNIPSEYGKFPPNNFWVANFDAVGFSEFRQQ